MTGKIDEQRIRELGGIELLAKQVVEGFITGLHKSPFHGFSVEFAEHRLYNKGESTRHIDWKLYARTEKLFVKRYEEETNLRCQIVIDNSSSMQFPQGIENNKMHFAVHAAAAISNLLSRQRDAVGLSVFNEKLDLHTPAKSSGPHRRFLFQQLENLLEEYREQDARQTFVVDSLHQIAESINRRSLVVIFSDMMDNSDQHDKIFSALQHLKHNKHEIILFHTVDWKKEIDFEFDNRPYTFVDMETNEQVKITPSQVKDNYRNKMEAARKNLKLKCGQYAIDFVEVDINKGYYQTLLEFLIKRQKMI